MERLKHKQRVEDFLKDTLGKIPEINYEIHLCSEESDWTSYEVRISNTTNDNKACAIIAAFEDEEGVQIEIGDEFYEVDEMGLFKTLFCWEFITYPES